MLNPNFLSTRSYIEMWFSNMIGSVQRIYRNNLPDNIDYIIGYWTGILKNEVFTPSQNLQANAYIDYVNALRFQLRHMNCDEIMNIIWPQLFKVDDEELSSESLPPLLNLNRTWLDSNGIFVVFNTFNVYLWIGKSVDPFYLDQLFAVSSLNEIPSLDISEEQVFFGELQQSKIWVQELYTIIQSLRISPLVYPEFKVLFEMDQRSEVVLKPLLLEDMNINYNMQNSTNFLPPQY